MQLDNIKKELPVCLKRIWVYFKIFAGIAVFAFILWKIPLTHTLWTNNAYTQYNATQMILMERLKLFSFQHLKLNIKTTFRFLTNTTSKSASSYYMVY